MKIQTKTFYNALLALKQMYLFENFNICKEGQKGFVQLLSLIPTSYPGHSILTEDIGEIVKDQKCNCYGTGTRFLIHGRLKNAELRGCSNI